MKDHSGASTVAILFVGIAAAPEVEANRCLDATSMSHSAPKDAADKPSDRASLFPSVTKDILRIIFGLPHDVVTLENIMYKSSALRDSTSSAAIPARIMFTKPSVFLFLH